MGRLTQKKSKWGITLYGLTISLLMPYQANAALGVSYDHMNYQALPQAVLYPFSYQGLVSIRENHYSSQHNALPEKMPEYWDVVAVGRDVLTQECGEDGRLEVLDYSKFPHKELLTHDAIQKCGIGFSLQAMTLNYALIHKYGVAPTYWADLFDFNRFPGKRALPKQSRYLFEVILLADGVKPSYVYPLLSTKEGQDRVLNKLDLIYDDIIWWSDVANLKLWLEQGFVTMSVAPDGAMLSQEGVNSIGVSREQVIYEMRYYGILKDSQQKDLAYAFISYATQPEQQLKLSNNQFYGPTIQQAWRLVKPENAELITNYPQNLQGGILLDYDFYAEYGDVLEKRFNEWLSTKQAPVIRVSMAEDMPIDTAESEAEAPVIEAVDFDEEEFMGPLPYDLKEKNDGLENNLE